jgi:primosomal protein N' (replication factor Y)
VCHSCNHRELLPAHCPECWSPRVKSFGVGTQRVVEEVAALFPGARALRWDRDSVGRKGDHERMLDSFLRHEADVLVGTQMIAKGLDRRSSRSSGWWRPTPGCICPISAPASEPFSC